MRVLVVEDDERLCEVYQDYLLEIGHDPLIANTAETALVKLRGERPGAVLLDIRLPGMSGMDFLQLQSTRELGIPIVVISGVLSEGEARECLRLGAVDYLGKPVVLDHLREVLRCLEPLADLPGPTRPSRSPERRRAPRTPVTLPVRVAEYDGNAWQATAVDLSTRGIKVRSDATVTPGAAARLSFQLDEGQRSLEVASVLVRADLDGYAFHFVNLADWQHERLRAFVEGRLDPSALVEPHARVLRSITQAFSATLDVDETLRLALHALTHVTGHEVSSLHLLSPDGQTLHLRGERGFSPQFREINRVLAVGEGLIGRVAATGRTARGAEETGFVCVPLQNRGRILGTLSLGRSTPEPFTDAEVALLEATANQICLALDNARLYSETRRQLEDLQTAETQAAQGERLSTAGKLAAGLVHEINNPLTAILGQAHLLMSAADRSPEERERLHVIIQETSRAARLLKSVLALSGPRRLQRRACELDVEVRTVLDVMRPQLEFAGIRTVTELSPVANVWVDPDQLRQVLINLVQNAQQAMADQPGERVLTLRTHAEDERPIVEVLDTGPGIPPEVLPRIFDAFFTTKAASEGTGLGLWVSYDIVEQHGGRLRADNRPEGGAVFTLELPRRRGA